MEMQPKVSLWDLLEKSRQADECLLDLDLDELRDLGDRMREKVDGYKFVVDRLTFRIAEIRGQMAELAEVKKQMETKLDAIKERMGETMTAQGFPKLAGEKWSVRCGKTKYVDIDEHVKADAHLAEAMPGCVTTKYELSKTGIRAVLDAGQSLEWARIKERPSIVFSALKE